MIIKKKEIKKIISCCKHVILRHLVVVYMAYTQYLCLSPIAYICVNILIILKCLAFILSCLVFFYCI